MKWLIALLLIAMNNIALAKLKTNRYLQVPKVIVDVHSLAHSNIQSHSDITILQQQEIQISGANDLAQVLNGNAGIQTYFSTGDPDDAIISMRGFGANAASNTLILINGRRLSNPDLAAADLAYIDLSTVKQIDLVNGSAGVLFGDQAVGGVINITTLKPPQKPHTWPKTNLSIDYGSYKQQRYHAYISQRFKSGFNLQLNGTKRKSNNYRAHNALDSHNISTQLGYDYNNGSIEIEYQHIKHDLLLAGALSSEQVRENRRQIGNNSANDFSNNETNIYLFHLQQQLMRHWQLQGTVSKRQLQNKSIVSNFPSKQTRRVILFNPHVTGTIPIKTDDILITAGTDIENDHYELRFSSLANNNVDDKRLLGSAYSQAILPFTTQSHFTVGVRGAVDVDSLNNNRQINHAFISEQGLSYNFLQHGQVFLRRAGSYRFPKADEQNNFSGGPVSHLKTQTGVSYEFGTNWQRKNYSLKLLTYRLAIKNEIAFSLPNNSQAIGTNRNLAPTRRLGASITTCWQPWSKTTLRANYAYVNGRFSNGVNKHNRIPLVSQNLARLSADYRFLHYWYLHIETIFTGSAYGAGDDANQSSLLGGYTLYNMNLGFNYQQWRLNARINNISNKKYYAYFVAPNAFYPAPERNFVLRLEFKL